MDILLFYGGHGADLCLAGRDVQGDESLYTAVLVSLFTDARADGNDELPPELAAENDLRGFWGDALVDGPSLGSKLWLLRREKQLPQVVRRAEQYAREALQWLMDGGYAHDVLVRGSVPRPGWLALAVSLSHSGLTALSPRTEEWNFTFDFTST